MNLTNQQIFDIKFILSGLKKKEIAQKINDDASTFSKLELNQYKDTQERLNHFFDKINPEINKLIDLLLSKNRDLEKSERSIVSEPTFEYKSKNDFLNEKIELLEKIIKEKERVIASQERTIYLYEKNILKPER